MGEPKSPSRSSRNSRGFGTENFHKRRRFGLSSKCRDRRTNSPRLTCAGYRFLPGGRRHNGGFLFKSSTSADIATTSRIKEAYVGRGGREGKRSTKEKEQVIHLQRRRKPEDNGAKAWCSEGKTVNSARNPVTERSVEARGHVELGYSMEGLGEHKPPPYKCLEMMTSRHVGGPGPQTSTRQVRRPCNERCSDRLFKGS